MERQTLEFERRQIASERNRDPFIAQTIGTVGMILAPTIPPLLAGYVIYTVDRTGSEDRSVSEVLITESLLPRTRCSSVSTPAVRWFTSSSPRQAFKFRPAMESFVAELETESFVIVVG